MDFGGGSLNWPHFVPCVLCDTFVSRCMMFVFCVKEADLGHDGLGSIFCAWVFRIVPHVFRMHHAPCTAYTTPLSMQYKAFLVIYRCFDEGGGGCTSSKKECGTQKWCLAVKRSAAPGNGPLYHCEPVLCTSNATPINLPAPQQPLTHEGQASAGASPSFVRRRCDPTEGLPAPCSPCLRFCG